MLLHRCAPCKQAAPFFNQVANDPKWKKKGVVFRKCNIDTASSVAMLCKVDQMPTFKVFKNGAEVETLLGWDEAGLREAIKTAIAL
jgi:thioredoxin 1